MHLNIYNELFYEEKNENCLMLSIIFVEGVSPLTLMSQLNLQVIKFLPSQTSALSVTQNSADKQRKISTDRFVRAKGDISNNANRT